MDKVAGGDHLCGLTIAVCGYFGNVNGKHCTSKRLEDIILKYGGEYTNKVTKETSFLVCSKKSLAGETEKMKAAKEYGVPLIKPSWLIDMGLPSVSTKAEDNTWSSCKGSSDVKTETDDDHQKNVSQGVARGERRERASQMKRKGSKTTSTTTSMAIRSDVNTEHVKLQGDICRGQPTYQIFENRVIGKGTNISIPLDDHCTLPTHQVWVNPDNGLVYDACLNKSDSSTNANKFYRIQVLSDTNSMTFKTWTRWGRVGEKGRSSVLGNGTQGDAIAKFKKKFKDKTGHRWDERSEDPKTEKYTFVERSYDGVPVSDIAVRQSVGNHNLSAKDEAPPTCTLKKPVADLMQLVFDKEQFQKGMSSLKYDATVLPLGKLNLKALTSGFMCLEELATLLGNPYVSKEKMLHETTIISDRYYSIIPHEFGRQVPPRIKNRNMLCNEIELLGTLLGMREANEMMKEVQKPKDSIHPVDRQFQCLDLQEMTPLRPNSTEFTNIERYLHGSCGATHDMNYDIRNIFRVKRNGEPESSGVLDASKANSDRRLLWHGSRVTNYAGILRQGLRIAPPEAPKTGYMFGKGIYLADMSSKSAGYCYHEEYGGDALLLLCEAELGDPFLELTDADSNAAENAKRRGMCSTKGVGRTGPGRWIDASIIHKKLKGVKMTLKAWSTMGGAKSGV
ncbi:hypothetical protein ACHAO7_009405 [Fusarium culmorum]